MEVSFQLRALHVQGNYLTYQIKLMIFANICFLPKTIKKGHFWFHNFLIGCRNDYFNRNMFIKSLFFNLQNSHFIHYLLTLNFLNLFHYRLENHTSNSIFINCYSYDLCFIINFNWSRFHYFLYCYF